MKVVIEADGGSRAIPTGRIRRGGVDRRSLHRAGRVQAGDRPGDEQRRRIPRPDSRFDDAVKLGATEAAVLMDSSWWWSRCPGGGRSSTRIC